jgi:type IV secretory pathway VirJ component
MMNSLALAPATVIASSPHPRLFWVAALMLLLGSATPSDSAAGAAQVSETDGAAVAQSLRDLPLTEVSATTKPEEDALAVLISGDGGFADLGQTIAKGIAGHGIPVVGLNSLKYFWKKRTPEQTATVVTAIIRYYSSAWGKRRVILIGYSFGADILPFVVNRLPADLRANIAVVALLGLSTDATFEFHPLNWLGLSIGQTLPTAPEIAGLSDLNVLCVYGVDETSSLCPQLTQPITIVQLPGGHHFDRDYAEIVQQIVKAAR